MISSASRPVLHLPCRWDAGCEGCGKKGEWETCRATVRLGGRAASNALESGEVKVCGYDDVTFAVKQAPGRAQATVEPSYLW